ncbi:MAG: segregation and condensation protein segregation and condensation protein [Candidatus Parcubacteria bacterium]|jgi:segregation and condensation protein B
MPLDVLVEAVLFYKATPQKVTSLQKLFGVEDGDEWRAALDRLQSRLQSGATRLIITDTELSLTTAPELGEFIETLRKSELKGDIGKAGAETLAIILYREPITRAEIDRIRGVNSSFIIRNLLVKGLISREATGNTFQFRITPELLAHLGVSKKAELPRFSEFMNAIDSFSTTPTETV